MTIHLDGIGSDWVVTRKPGGKPELNSFSSLEELQKILLRSLAKAGTVGPAPSPPAPRRTRFEAPPVPKNGVSSIILVPEPQLDCMSCGACCAAKEGSKAHVLLGKGERDRLGRKLPVVRRDNGDHIRTRRNADGDTVCAALEGTVGSKCSCSVYDTRPMICQLFEVGGKECLEARAFLKIKA